jgi:hypothetical protein
MLGLENNTFSKNLWLTQQYCEQQIANVHKSNAAILRSYNPMNNSKSMFSFRFSNFSHPGMGDDFFQTDWAVDPFDQGNEKLVEGLFDMQLIFKEGKIEIPDTSKDFAGEILVARIDETVVDGASSVMSIGLIDDFDCPPIDTWFYLTGMKGSSRLLFSWIPQKFYELANEAILVNCVDCLGWYKDWFPKDYVSSMHSLQNYKKMSWL